MFVFIISIIPKLVMVYKSKFLSCNNLNYSDDVSRTKRIIKGTEHQNEYLFIAWKIFDISLLFSVYNESKCVSNIVYLSTQIVSKIRLSL